MVQSIAKEKEATCFLHSLKLRKKYLHPFHKELARTYDALAETHSNLGHFEEAAQCCQSSIAILEKIFGEYSMELAYEYCKLAQLMFHAKQTAKTLEVIEKAEAIFGALEGRTRENASLKDLRQMKAFLLSTKK